jgi:hypothetical protein
MTEATPKNPTDDRGVLAAFTDALRAALRPSVATVQPEAGDGVFHRMPTYLPPGFRFRRRFVGLGQSFGGADDVAVWFVNDACPIANAKPLIVYGSRAATRPLAGTSDDHGRPVRFGLGKALVSATYHDGMWWLAPNSALEWNTGDVHSLTFMFDGVTYGVRGLRSMGVDLAELTRVAASLA